MMSESSQPTGADSARGDRPLLPDPAARRRRSPLDVALIFAAVVAIGGVAFAGGRATATPSAAALAAQNCGTGNTGGGGGVPGAPEAPNTGGGG